MSQGSKIQRIKGGHKMLMKFYIELSVLREFQDGMLNKATVFATAEAIPTDKKRFVEVLFDSSDYLITGHFLRLDAAYVSRR